MFALKIIESGFIMYFYHKVDDSVLLDLLAIHTNRLTQIMIYGETYTGEYNASKRTLELLQNEIISRNKSFSIPTRSYPAYQPSAA